jgi:hypothetical protein
MPTLKPKRLKNLKIAEISSVDRGAGDGVKVVLRKRDEIFDQIDYAMDALRISCESIITDDTLVDKQAAVAETMGEAEDYFAKLLADYQADGDVVPAQKQVTVKPMQLSPYEQMVVKATELRKEDPKLTAAQAFAKIYSDPKYCDLADADRAARRAAGAQRVSKMVAKVASRTPISDRVASRAAALAQQFDLSHDEAVQRLLARDKDLAAAYQREQAA